MVEVPFSLTTTANCMNYVDLILTLQADCEDDYVYQYGTTVVNGDVQVNYDIVYGPLSVSAAFSVSWSTSGSLQAPVLSTGADSSATSSSDLRNIDIAIITLLIIVIMIFGFGFWKLFSMLKELSTQRRLNQFKNLGEFYEQKPKEFKGEANSNFDAIDNSSYIAVNGKTSKKSGASSRTDDSSKSLVNNTFKHLRNNKNNNQI